MKRALFVFLIALAALFSQNAKAQYLDLSNVNHINDPFIQTNYTFSYSLNPDGHTLHCHFVFYGFQSGTIIQPALYVYVYNYGQIVGFNDDDHSFIANGETQCFDYDVDLGTSGITFAIDSGYDNMSLTDPYYYYGTSGSDEDVVFVPW